MELGAYNDQHSAGFEDIRAYGEYCRGKRRNAPQGIRVAVTRPHKCKYIKGVPEFREFPLSVVSQESQESKEIGVEPILNNFRGQNACSIKTEKPFTQNSLQASFGKINFGIFINFPGR